MQINEKIALVTGGASGIGRATAARLKANGATVVIADIDGEAGTKAAAELGTSFHVLDVREPRAWATTLDAVVSQHGRLDIAHLNAGLLTPQGGERGTLGANVGIDELRDEDYARVTSVNIDGVVFGTRAVVRAMTRAGSGGAIVATASVAGVIPFAQDPIYTMTKHAVVGFVRSLAPVLEPQGITMNAVCPGIVRTNIAASEAFDMLSSAGVGVMDPSEIGDAVVGAIESGETGQCLVCLPRKAPSKQEFPELDIA